MAKSSIQRIKDDGRKVLAELQKHSKENIDLIAKNCGFSRQKVWRYVKRFEENRLIWGYTAVVDEQKQGVQKFILLLKRTQKKFDDKTLDEITRDKFKNAYEPIGVTIESSYYVNGEYDWMVIFTASDLIQAKKFSNILFEHHPGIAEKVNLMQIIFTQRDHYITNPDQTNLREFL
jgi:DNA-binding Lrp family transcriptional regulator